MSASSGGGADSVKVAVRVRPYIHAYEKVPGIRCIVKMRRDAQQTILINPKDGKERAFTFDFSYNSFLPTSHPDHASQDTVWQDLGVDVLENAWSGFNVSLFAYGQTGSGKSHSMMGYPGAEGIVPRACREIFTRIQAGGDDVAFKVEASMLEIYNERVRDLFNPSKGGTKGLKVRDNPKTGPYVQNLTKLAVGAYADLSGAMEAGTRARTVAATAMNATSSRAHTLFQITLTQTAADGGGQAKDKASAISLIDLAGSERADRTGASGDRLKEGSAINQSLSALGNVISALAEKATNPRKKNLLVPYRDSVLTHLLKNSLGGNSKTIMIAAISPSDVNYDETLSTLRYADRAKQIKNKAVVNEDPNVKLVRGLQEEIMALKAKLLSESSRAPADAGELRQKWEEKKGSELHQLREQMLENERLLKESQKSWEDKLREAESSTSVQSSLMQRLGLRQGGRQNRSSEPHLTNLNQDSQLSEVLTYFLAEGDTHVGRDDAEIEQDVVLSGLSIKAQHCTIRNSDGALSLIAAPGAKTFLNGKPAEDKTIELSHGDRLVFGNNHIFSVRVPLSVSHLNDAEREELRLRCNWEYAMKEMNELQMQALTEGEKKARQRAEREASEMETKVRELEERMREERRNAEHAVAAASEAERDRHIAKQRELEEALKQQIESTNRMQARKEKEARQRSLLDEQLLRTIPLVNEGNAISEELNKSCRFAVKLLANQHQARLVVESDEGDLHGAMETEVWIRFDLGDVDSVPLLWSHEKFLNRLYLMREMYQDFVECGRDLDGIDYDDESDPFYDPPEAQLIGKAFVMLDALHYFLSIEDSPPIIDYRGKTDGCLQVALVLDDDQVESIEDYDKEEEKTLYDIVGQALKLRVRIDAARGLPRKLCNSVTISYTFFGESYSAVPLSTQRTSNPSFSHVNDFEVDVTPDFVEYIGREALEFQVWGSPEVLQGNDLSKGPNGGEVVSSPARAASLARRSSSGLSRGGGSASRLRADSHQVADGDDAFGDELCSLREQVDRLVEERDNLQRTTDERAGEEGRMRVELEQLQKSASLFSEARFKELERKLAQSKCDIEQLETKNKMLQDTLDHNNSLAQRSSACSTM